MNGLQIIVELLSVLRRRSVLIGAVMTIGLLYSLYYALSLPRSYETAAVIQIEQPSIRDPLTQSSTVNAATLQKLQIIEQRVMARSNLLDIIRKYDLFADQPGLSVPQKVGILRSAASVRRISDPTLQWRSDITPTAMMITVRLGDPVVAADVANELVTNVLEQDRARRAARVGESLEFFESEERRVGEAIADLEENIALFKRRNAESLPEAVPTQRSRLADLREADLELEREIIALSTGRRESTIITNQIAQVQEQRALFVERAVEIEDALARAPQIEQTLNGLERELDKLTDQYQIITRNQAEAEMGQMLELSEQAESFIVLEPAITPIYPVSPSRKKIVVMGVAVSAILAAAGAFILELRNPAIRTAAQMERQIGIRAVVSIPTIESTAVKMRRRLIWAAGAGATAFVALVLAGLILRSDNARNNAQVDRSSEAEVSQRDS